MAIHVAIIDEQREQDVDVDAWERFATAVLEALAFSRDVELSIRFVDIPTITQLNEEYLSHVGPTDVLSFPLEDDPTALSTDAATLLLGDVVICPVVAYDQAPEHAGRYEDELALLIVHGILHLIGMDHEDDEEADAMEAREQLLLAHCAGVTP